MDTKDYLLEFIRHSRQSVFLTGKAGTGKTTLLRRITSETYKHCIVAAPTGIAALNAGGVTLHSLFQLPSGLYLPTEPTVPIRSAETVITPSSYWRQSRMHASKRKLLRSLELLIIDEVSMLRADTLDCIDMILRRVRRSSEPFGGVQILFIGDLLQLPPVVKPHEWELMSQYYQGVFFFQAQVLETYPLLHIELDKVYRQSDDRFVSLLNNLRSNILAPQDIEVLNEYVRPNFDSTEHDDYIMLTTHNHKVDAINRRALDKLPNRSYYYEASIDGDFPEYLYPTERRLELKLGARVMFLRNDTAQPRRYYNGKIGVVSAIGIDHISVYLEDSKITVDVEPYEWTNVRYVIDTSDQSMRTETLGTYRQYPLRAAWAITVHKSQGLTFERAVIDLEHVFTAGQAYVALSRLTSLDGLVLLAPVASGGIVVPEAVRSYTSEPTSIEHMDEALRANRRDYWREQTLAVMDWGELADLWREHSYSYRAESERSLKSSYGDWASETAAEVIRLHQIALRFRAELYQLWSAPTVDIGYIRERIGRAVLYFEAELRAIALSVETNLLSIGQQRSVKQFAKELDALGQAVLSMMQRLYRIRAMVNALADRSELSQQALGISELVQRWKNEIHTEALERVPKAAPKDRDDELSKSRKGKKGKASQQPKPARERTQDITLELYRSGLAPEEIAANRGLSLGTIYGHLAYQLALRQIPPDELIDLSATSASPIMAEFSRRAGYISLREVYEALGGSVSYELLRLYQAYYQTYIRGDR